MVHVAAFRVEAERELTAELGRPPTEEEMVERALQTLQRRREATA